MRDALFIAELDRHGGNLQQQIREMVVAAILDDQLPAGSPMPSGRALARQLGVARNTVVLAYEQLVVDGYLLSRERSGYYVAGDILAGRVPIAPRPGSAGDPGFWNRRIRFRYSAQRNIVKPSDWRSFPYSFIYGQFDPALFPIADWRECERGAMSIGAIHDWAGDRVDRDDPALIEQIHTRLLPRRGVWADREEILVTIGAQHALFLIAELLGGRRTTVAMENPGYPDARNLFAAKARRVVPVPIDDSGMCLDPVLRQCDCVYTTPSHQFPSTITMTLDRRRALLDYAERYDFIIVEDDYESETNFVGEPTPALKSLDRHGRVLYVGSLSKTLAPGIRLGYLVGPADFIREARALRRLMIRHPPANNQHIVARFLRAGHHDSLVRRLSHSYRERWQIMGEILTRHFPQGVRRPGFGGTAYWVEGPAGLDGRALQARARIEGILIEAGDVFFAEQPPPLHFFRLGFSSVPAERIEPGIRRLAALVGEIAGRAAEP